MPSSDPRDDENLVTLCFLVRQKLGIDLMSSGAYTINLKELRDLLLTVHEVGYGEGAQAGAKLALLGSV